ncbi:DUF262 domain-containing protein [Anaerolentibacter hominis]|uniref:DUF262 domain-containing protein n=1 Tax=Anaerolentibacter hominis TaxID=3079009 RepID=UPI0031B86007
MSNIAILKRDSTKITISEFYERYNLDKYNFQPRYQRRSDVWDMEKQSFLIDSILKNYPMPPIFLHQRIDEASGSTKYDVIDGKQRLTAITEFLKNRIPLPQDFDEGAFGNSKLNGIYFQDLEGELAEYKKQLWRYVITVEYIDSDELDIIDNVFDRLNRNGEPLEPQELRKAKYHNTLLLDLIMKAVSYIDWSKLEKIRFNRMQDTEFVSELVFYLLDGEAADGISRTSLDEKYEKWSVKLTREKQEECIENFRTIVDYLNHLELDFDAYRIKGVSHFYALFAFCYECIRRNADIGKVSGRLNEFYRLVRAGQSNYKDVEGYRISMQSNTRAKFQRKKRIDCLINFCLEN